MLTQPQEGLKDLVKQVHNAFHDTFSQSRQRQQRHFKALMKHQSASTTFRTPPWTPSMNTIKTIQSRKIRSSTTFTECYTQKVIERGLQTIYRRGYRVFHLPLIFTDLQRRGRNLHLCTSVMRRANSIHWRLYLPGRESQSRNIFGSVRKRCG